MILKLKKKFGTQNTLAFLRMKMAEPANYWLFASNFADDFQNKIAPFHRDFIGMVTKNYTVPVKGKYAFAAPRGGAKSTLFNRYVLWLALNGHLRFILYISDTHTQAKLHVGSIKNDVENNKAIQAIYPNAMGEKWGEEGIVINGIRGDCFILPLGSGMKVRGLKYKTYRPGLVVLDDLENSEIVYSKERRDKLKNWFDFDLDLGLDRYNKNIIFIGTILHHQSLLKKVIDGKDKYAGWNRKLVKGLTQNDTVSFWEDRFSVEYLKAIRDDRNHPDFVGSIVFTQEIQNEPQDDKDRIIKISWIKYWNFHVERKNLVVRNEGERMNQMLNRFSERIGALDPAISEKASADFFAMYAFGFEQKTANEYMLDLVRVKEGDINKQVELICNFIQNWKLHKFGIESVQYQAGLARMVKQELNRRKIYSCRVVKIRTDKDKIRRAKIHSSAFEAGFIHLREEHPLSETLVSEITGFPLETHDDTLDALMLARETRRRRVARTFAKKPNGM